MKKLFFTLFILLAAQHTFAAVVINASITGSSPNSIYQYMSPSKTIVTLSSSTFMDNNYVRLQITNNTTGATLRNNTGVSIMNFFASPMQTLTYTDLSNLMNPPSLTVTGFSTAELTAFNNNGTLPDGNYTFCFEYWGSISTMPQTNQTDPSSNNCPAGINISAAAQTVSVNTNVSFNMFNRNFSQLSSPGVVNTIITSNVNDYYRVTFAITITGSNGLVIASKSTKCSTALSFDLGPSTSVTHMATGAEITDAFDLNGLNITGPANLVNNFNSRGILPDGNYTICFRGQTNCNNISDPTLGCASFTVAADPVIITAPFVQAQTMEHKFDNLKTLQPSFMLMSKTDYPQNVFIRLKVTGDNGVSFQSTPVFFIPAIQANVPLSLQVSDIAYFFISSNTFNITGLNATQFQSDGLLPDGNYTFCYEVFDVDGTTKISAPGTGCYQLRIASDPIHVMTVAAPFSERDFDNIASKISAVTLTTQSDYTNLKVILKFTGNNGVNITTNLSASPVNIPNMTANVPIVLNTTQIASLFDKSALLISGVPAQFNIDGRLPDGTYTVCFEVYNINNALVSDPITSTCALPFTLSGRSNSTSISLNEPPMIIMPHCGDAIVKTDPQNMIFSWLMPSSLNMMRKLGNQDYILKVVEINNPNANPYDAFRSATTPLFFQKTVTGNSYVYGPADPRLEPGKKYAFAVQVARDFLDFRNNGQSDICWFTYGVDTTANKIMLRPENKKKIERSVATASTISAQLMFTHGRLKDAGNPAKVENYADHAQDENTPYPIRKQNVRLVSAVSVLPVYKVKIRVPQIVNKDTTWKWVMVDSLSPVSRADYIKPCVSEVEAKLNSIASKSLNKTVATGTTDEFGNITFNIPVNNPYPVIIDTLMPAGFTQQMDTMKMMADYLGVEWPYGAVDHWVIARGYAIDLANPLYTDPNIFFTPVKANLVNAEKVVTNISSFRLSVRIKDNLILESGSANTFKNVVNKGPVTVYVLKKQMGYNYPEYEGNPVKRGQLTLPKGLSGDVVDQTYTILDKMEIPYNETAHFLRQYYSVYTTDKYYIYAVYDKGNTFYEAKPFSKPVQRAWNTYDPDEENIYRSESMQLSPDLVDGVVKGRLTYSFYDFNTKSRLSAKQMPKGVTLKLVQMKVDYDGKKNTYSNIKEIDVTTTNQNGDFTFKTGKLQYNDYLALTGSGSFNNKLYVIVSNAYYHSPTASIYIKPQATITNLGTLECYVRQGEYASKIIAKIPKPSADYLAESNWVPRVGDKVFLCRKKGVTLAGLPEDEGSLTKSSLSKQTIKDLEGNEYTVIDETTTGDKGRYKFSRVVFRDNNNKNDKLYIFSEVPFGSYENFRTPKPYDLNMIQENATQLKLNVDYKPQTYGTCYNSNNGWCGEESFPQDPYIVGAVYPVTNPTEVLEGVKIEMFNLGSMKLDAGKKYVAENKGTAEDVKYTADNGKFEFRDILKGAPGWKILRFTKKGFIPKIVVINNGAPLKKGQRESLDKVYLELPITTYCYTKDADGNGVSGKIIVGDNFSWAPATLVYAPEYGTAAKLECPSGDVQFIFIPNNTDEYAIDTFTKNISILTKSFTHTIKKARHRISISLVDKSTLKAIPFKAVITNLPTQLEAQSIKFIGSHFTFFEFSSAGTHFDIKIIPDDYHEIVNITVNSKPGKTTQFINLKAAAARVITGTVSYKTTTQFAGKKINVDKAIEGASVYIKGFENSIGTATTEKDGSYSLGHIPIQTYYTITAAMEDGWIGQTKKINSNQAEYKFKSGKLVSQNFTLTKFTEFDISHLYGFPLLVEKLTDNGESVVISGKIKLNPGDDGKPKKAYQPIKEIDMTGDEVMLASVSNAVLKKSNYRPDLGDLSKNFEPYLLDVNILPYILYSAYAGTLENKKGLQLVPNNSSGTAGAVKGYASIDPASFSKGFSYTGNIYLNSTAESIKEKTTTYKTPLGKVVEYQPGYVYTGPPLSEMSKTPYGKTNSGTYKTTEIGLFTSSGKVPSEFASGFRISDDDANTLVYTLHNYEEVETRKNSTFDKNGLHMESLVHTDLLHVEETPDIKLNLGTVHINTAYVQSVTSKTEFKISLGKWGIIAEEWNMGQGGLKVTKGRLEASALTVPFSGMLIGQQEMSFAKFEFSSVKLLNNEKLKLGIDQSNTITGFGFDKGYGGSESKGAWSLSIIAKSGGYLSAIAGLPDLEPSDKILISNINLYNTGDDKILLKENHPAVTIAGVTKFYPTAIWGSQAEIKFKGNISLEIPNLTGLSNVSYDLIFKTDKNKQLVHAPSETKIKGLQLKAKGVEINFSDKNQSLANKEARFYGTLTDADPQSKYSFQVILVKAAGPNGKCEISLNKEKGVVNTFPLDKSGKAKLDNLMGSMLVTGKEWGNFTFEGDIKGVTGVDEPDNKDKHLKFVIKGDLVAEGSKVGVKNMNGPSGSGMSGLSLTYDFEKSGIVGSGHMDQAAPNGRFVGDIELFMGGEWYFFASIKVMNLANCPINEFGAAIFIGNGVVNQNMKTAMAGHFHENKLPSYITGLQKHTGVVFAGGFEIPIPQVPTWDLNIGGLVKSSFHNGIYAGCYFSLTFASDAELSIGGRVGAWVELGAGATIGIACFNINLKADAGVGIEGTIKKSGAFSIKVDVYLTLSGSAYVGGGVCNSDCQTPCWETFLGDVCSPIPCVKTGMSGGETITLTGELNNSGFKLSFK